MKKNLFPILIIVLAAVLGAAWYWQWKEEQSTALELPPLIEAPAEPGEPPKPRYPIPAPVASPAADDSSTLSPGEQAETGSSPEPLPTLNESNPSMAEVISGLFGAERVAELFNLDEIVRRFVVTVDNLPRKKLPRRQFSVKPVSGPFLVMGEEDAWSISPDNAARYAPYVKLLTGVDIEQLVALYVRFYPVFQEAYVELGYPDAYFNDRLVEVIDNLLATPMVEEPIALVRPHVFYEYADPKLEALSAGQKILLRMGRANADAVKAKLAVLRRAVIKEN